MRLVSNMGDERPLGHTAQYMTLARALGLALQIAEGELNEIESRGHTINAASLQIEARFVTIVILAAAVCESLANTLLADNLNPSQFEAVERLSTPKKWIKEIPSALGCSQFVQGQLARDLTELFELRNSIMHPKAEVYGATKTIHKGNAGKWDCLREPSFVRHLAAVPVKLSEAVPVCVDNDAFMIAHGVREHVLIRALNHEPKAFQPKS